MSVAIIGGKLIGLETYEPRPLRARRRRLAAGQTMPRVRGDTLPEETRYRDDGCSISPTCLTCPLPRCRYEDPGGLRAILNEPRDRQILALRAKGASVPQLSARFGVSKRTVFRIIETAARRRAERRRAPIYIGRRAFEKEAQCA